MLSRLFSVLLPPQLSQFLSLLKQLAAVFLGALSRSEVSDSEVVQILGLFLSILKLAHQNRHPLGLPICAPIWNRLATPCSDLVLPFIPDGCKRASVFVLRLLNIRIHPGRLSYIFSMLLSYFTCPSMSGLNVPQSGGRVLSVTRHSL